MNRTKISWIVKILHFLKNLFRSKAFKTFLDSMGQERRCGACPSPNDDRDYELDRLVPTTSATFPREFSLTRPSTIRDQGQIGSYAFNLQRSSRNDAIKSRSYVCWVYLRQPRRTYMVWVGYVPKRSNKITPTIRNVRTKTLPPQRPLPKA